MGCNAGRQPCSKCSSNTVISTVIWPMAFQKTVANEKRVVSARVTVKAYSTPKRLDFIVAFSGIVQSLYRTLVTNFPFNPFLVG